MRWAARLLRSATTSRPPVRRARLLVRSLEDRAVPSATLPDDPASTVGLFDGLDPEAPPAPQAPFPQVGDRVWKDLNGNGLQDPGEPGIAGVTLQLFQGTRLVGTTVTDGQGAFAFNRWDVTNGTADTADDGLVAGTAYQIRVAGTQSALLGLRATTTDSGGNDQLDSDAVAGAAGATLDFTMGPGELYSHYDLGFTAAGSIGSVVWSDANNNGVKDANETGLAGVAVRLLDASGTTEVATTTTGSDGSYLFNGLAPGTYIVEIAPGNFATAGTLHGCASSTGASGQVTGPYEGARTPDPNGGRRGVYDHGTAVDGAVRCKPVAVVGDALNNQMAAFGFFQPGTVAGKVFVDVNANGRIDFEDQAGVAGVKVTAAGPAGVFTARTDASGSYSLTNLPAGTYTVTEVQPGGYRSSTPNLLTVTVGPGAPVTANFGEATAADLAVTLTARPSPTPVGGIVVLTYRVRNVGTADASGITLAAPVPSGLQILSVTQTGGTLDKATRRATIPTLAPGGEAVFTVRVRALMAGQYRLTATVQGTSPEDQVGNNRSVIGLSIGSPPPAPPSRPVIMLASAFRR